MTGATITLKQLMRRACELVADGWIQGRLFAQATEEVWFDNEGEALLPGNRPSIQRVCSVGAMRLAFAEIVGAPIHRHDYGDGEVDEYVDMGELIRHPLYQEGMKVLGKAFYEAEQLSDAIRTNPGAERLLNGEGGRPYTWADVEEQVIRLNDWEGAENLGQLRTGIVAAFERAVEMAPEDITEEAFGDRVLDTV